MESSTSTSASVSPSDFEYDTDTWDVIQAYFKEIGLVKHHLIGFREPWESISAGEYSDMVIEITKNY